MSRAQPCPTASSPSRSGPSGAKIAILTAHGQPSAPAPAEKALAQLAQEVAKLLPDWEIRSATLASPGRLEQVMEDGALIYPFFMASGWFTSQVLPKRLQGFTYQQLPPFGQDPALPQLTAELLQQTIRPAPSPGADTPAPDKPVVLLTAHGSARGPKAAEATEDFARALRPLLPSLELCTCYIEQPPFVADVAKDLPPGSLCLPFFAQSGNHVTGDIPEALAEAQFTGKTLAALGRDSAIPDLISRAILRAIQTNLTDDAPSPSLLGR